MVYCSVTAPEICDFDCVKAQHKKDCPRSCVRGEADCNGTISYQDKFHLHVQCGSWDTSYTLYGVSSEDDCDDFTKNTTALMCGTCGIYSRIKIWMNDTNRLCNAKQGEQVAVCRCKLCFYRSIFCCDRLHCGCKVLAIPTTTASQSTTEEVTTSTVTPATYTTQSITTRPTYGFSQTVSEGSNMTPQIAGDNSVPAIGGAVGGSLVVLLVSFVLIALFCRFRRKRTKKPQQNETYENLRHVSYSNRTSENTNSNALTPGSQTHSQVEYDYADLKVVQPTDRGKSNEEECSLYAYSPDQVNQNVAQPTYQDKENEEDHSPYANSPDQLNQDGINSFKAKSTSPDNAALGHDNKYFVLERENNGKESAPELVNRNEDKVAASVADEGTYNELNQKNATASESPNSMYHHVKHGGGSSMGDYDQFQKHGKQTAVGLDDDYDHCKPINPKPSADTADEMSDENYDRLR